MATKLQYLCTHCTDTPFGRNVTPDDITMWHKGAAKQSNGKYKFLGGSYNLEELSKLYLQLPSGKKISADRTVGGRGWLEVGYSDMIMLDGTLVNLVPYTFDDTVSSWEVTNGATGYNGKSRHVVLVGGWSKDGNRNGHADSSGKPTDKIDVNFTQAQIATLKMWYEMQLEHLESVKIIGHNDIAGKTCPNFLVNDEFLKDLGIK